jgi:hypothetical protein
VVAHPEKERRNLSEVPDLLLNVDPEMVVAAQGGDAMALDQLLDELAPYVRRLCAGVAPAAVVLAAALPSAVVLERRRMRVRGSMCGRGIAFTFSTAPDLTFAQPLELPQDENGALLQRQVLDERRAHVLNPIRNREANLGHVRHPGPS